MKTLLNELSKLSPIDIVQEILFDNIEWDAVNPMNNWESYGFICKDIIEGEILRVKELCNVDNSSFSVTCLGGVNLICNLKKEKKFFEINGEYFYSVQDFCEWLKSEAGKNWFLINDVFVSCIRTENGLAFGSLLEAHVDHQKQEFLTEIKNSQTTYKAFIKDKNVGGFIAIVNGVETFLPGSLASANKIIDFDSFIGKTINVMLEDYIKDGDTFIVSNKKYIQKVLPTKLNSLQTDNLYEGEVTGTSKFGIFIEFDDIFTGLLHTSEMTSQTKEDFYNSKFKPGTKINFYIKEVLKDNRIILSEIQKTDEIITIEEFKETFENKVAIGEVTSYKPYGYFVKFTIKQSTFIGLLYIKEVEHINLQIGEQIPCYISEVDIDSKKIFLKYFSEND